MTKLLLGFAMMEVRLHHDGLTCSKQFTSNIDEHERGR